MSKQQISPVEKRRSDAAELAIEKRAEGEQAGRPVIVGYAAVYNQLSNPIERTFRERIAPGAFTHALGRSPDVRATIDHDPTRLLGRTTAGTLRLSNNAKGLRVEIDPPDTVAGRDIQELIRRGDINAMSFAFEMVEDDWQDEIIDGDRWPVRTLKDLNLRDVAIATVPIYPQTEVEVGLRSAREYLENQKCRTIGLLVRYLKLLGGK